MALEAGSKLGAYEILLEQHIEWYHGWGKVSCRTRRGRVPTNAASSLVVREPIRASLSVCQKLWNGALILSFWVPYSGESQEQSVVGR